MSLAILTVAVLMLLGVVLRQTLRPLRWLFIPGSVIAGFVGLVLVNLLGRFGGAKISGLTAEVNATLSGWPGPLIAVVFAAMMLQQSSAGSPRPRDESATRRVARQGVMVWIIVLGETWVGLLATWMLIQPFYELPNSFGMLIETGFAGGHGTAGAMGQVFSSPQVGLPAGLDLGLLMATCGLVYGVISGIFWINLAVRLGWLPLHLSETAEDRALVSERKPIGYQTTSPDAIDPLLLQVVWIALAVGVGMLLQTGVMWAAEQIDLMTGHAKSAEVFSAELSKRLSASSVMDFPLFIYTMFGGWIIRRVLRLVGQSDRIDSATIQRLSSTAMEVLVVAAITSLKPSAVAALLGPFAILFVCGAIWTAVCLMVISRWILPQEHWFPLALINYGMSTGTTATGFVLLRVVDPELKTNAASDYALAAPLSAPFIGGGIVTFALPLMLLERVSMLWPLGVIGAVVIGLIVVGRRLGRVADPGQ